MTRQRWILLVQLLFFLAWGVWLLQHHESGATLWLETKPVDPRDLLSGNYVSLRFKIQEPQADTCKRVLDRENDNPSVTDVWVRLRPGAWVTLESGESVQTWESDLCVVGSSTQSMPASSSEIWARGRIVKGMWSNQLLVEYGIERYFVSETSPLRVVSSGTVAARVTRDAQGALHIQDLKRLLPVAVPR